METTLSCDSYAMSFRNDSLDTHTGLVSRQSAERKSRLYVQRIFCC